jgi:hypothetical protein
MISRPARRAVLRGADAGGAEDDLLAEDGDVVAGDRREFPLGEGRREEVQALDPLIDVVVPIRERKLAVGDGLRQERSGGFTRDFIGLLRAQVRS